MEPLFFKAENTFALEEGKETENGFNGAAFFQSGKCRKALITTNLSDRLQWSRFFSKRKIPDLHRDSQTRYGFNGAAFFQSGKSVPSGSGRARYLASMEPLFFKAENRRCIRDAPQRQIASMEPLFFKAENAWSTTSVVLASLLQWSRFFSKRKIRRGRLTCLFGTLGFNGAAFFQSGK